MNRDGSIQCEFDVALPELALPDGGAKLWGRVAGTVEGKANPDQAIGAFDATRQQPFEQVAETITGNVQGWITWAIGEVYRRYVTERDALEWLTDPSVADAEVRELCKPQFDPWTFSIDRLDYSVTLDPEAIRGLPADLQSRLSGGGARTVKHTFSGDIPPVRDPGSGNEIKVRCNASITFALDLDKARAALDPAGTLADDRLERAALGKAEEWYWYGVKQSFYNWIYDTGKTHRRFVREYALIHPDVMALCRDGLAQHGIDIQEAMVRYEALDPDSAWALTAPGQSGGAPAVPSQNAPSPAQPVPAGAPPPASTPNHQRAEPGNPNVRASSEQAMAATIAIMDVNDLPLPMPGGGGGLPPGQPLPPVEESVWRHQKAVMKENPGLDRSGCAVKILERLKQDGYSVDERKRIATIIGGDPSTVID